ncbi:MAG: ribonuclease T [Pseudomonadota bacterium]
MTDAYRPGAPFTLANRFRGFLPVVVDVETGGFESATDALLEIAAVVIGLDEAGQLAPTTHVSTHVIPFEGARLDPASLAVNGIDPWHPLRAARNEVDALSYIFKPVREAVKAAGCNRAVLVGHNAAFDQGFLNAALARTGIKRNPFHPFSHFDTVSLAGLAFGQTVLARAVRAAGLEWDNDEAHSALYDTRKTAELFCHIVNSWEHRHR